SPFEPAHSGLSLQALSVLGDCQRFTYFEWLLDIVRRRNSQSARWDMAVKYPRKRTSPLTGPTRSCFLALVVEPSSLFPFPFFFSCNHCESCRCHPRWH